MNNAKLTPFATELSALMSKTAEFVPNKVESVTAPKKMRKKVLDKKLARVATAPVKPVAGANAGPAKLAASRYSDLSLLRRNTLEKTAGLQKIAYMEKRAAAKQGLAQALEKNAMLKEAAIQLMVKEAFMCELYKIAEETGDWRLKHSLAWQEEMLLEEFEKQAFIQAGKALWAGTAAAGKTLKSSYGLARSAGQGVFRSMGSAIRQAKPVFSKARATRAQALQAGKDVATATKGVEKAKVTGKKARTQAMATAQKQGLPQAEVSQAGRQAYQAEIGGARQALTEAQKAQTAATGTGFARDASGNLVKGQGGGRLTRKQRKAMRDDYRQTQRELTATGGRTAPTDRAMGNTQLGMTGAQQERQVMLANKAKADAAKRPFAVRTPAGNAGASKGGGKGTAGESKAVASRREDQAFFDRRDRALAGDVTAQRVIANKPTGRGPIKAPATSGPAAGPAAPAKANAPATAPAAPATAPATAPAGEGLLQGPAFTQGTMPQWMPKAVSDKWAALTPEQRRLWAIGGMAGAGGITAGAIAG